MALKSVHLRPRKRGTFARKKRAPSRGKARIRSLPKEEEGKNRNAAWKKPITRQPARASETLERCKKIDIDGPIRPQKGTKKGKG